VDYTGFTDWAFGIHKAIKSAASKAKDPPKKKGADAPNPPQLPAPCQRRPAISDAGKARIPIKAW